MYIIRNNQWEASNMEQGMVFDDFSCWQYNFQKSTCRSWVDEDFVWKVLHQLLLALQECHQHMTQGEKVCAIHSTNIIYHLPHSLDIGLASRYQACQCVSWLKEECKAWWLWSCSYSAWHIPGKDICWHSLLHESSKLPLHGLILCHMTYFSLLAGAAMSQ